MKRILLAMLLSVWISSVPAFAQCEKQIDDQANVFGEKAPQVQAAIDRLVSDTGADVHVFTVSSMGTAPTFEKYVRHIISTCPAWQGVDSDVKGNLIVVALALKERKTAIIFGSEWTPALNSQHQRIQATNMNPRFKSGDFAGGFVAGLIEIDRVGMAFFHPTTQTQQTPIPLASPDTRPVSTTNVDFSGLGTFLLWCLIIVGGAAYLYFLYQWLRYVGEKRAERKLAQQKAVRAKQKVMERALSSEIAVREVGAEVFSLRQVVSESDAAQANSHFSDAESLCKEGMQLHLRLLQTSSDPEKSGLTAGQYYDLFREYEEVEKIFLAMDKSLNSAMTEVKKVSQLVKNADATVQAAEAAIVDGEDILQTVKLNALRVPLADEAYEDAQRFLKEARESIARKDYRLATVELKGVLDATARINKLVRGVMEKKEGLDKSIVQIEESLKGVPGMIDEARASLEKTREKFNVLDVELASESLENAREAAETVGVELEVCKSHYDFQRWDEASEALQRADTALNLISVTCKAIDRLPATLAKLEAELDGKVAQAEALVKKLSDFVSEHKYELPTDLSSEVERFVARLRSLTENVRGWLTGVAESTDTADTLIKDGEEFLSRAATAVRKVEQGRARAHERNRSAQLQGRASGGRSKDKKKSRSSAENVDHSTFIVVDNSSNDRDDSDRSPSRSSSHSSGSSSRRSSDSGGGDSSWGSSSDSGGGSSSWGGGDFGSSGGGDSSW